MRTVLFLSLAAVLSFVVGCSRGGDATTAAGPQQNNPYGYGMGYGQGYGQAYGQGCMANGGYGCGWQTYPNYTQPYPMTNGYYAGYNGVAGTYGYGGYSYFAGCTATYGTGWSPIYQAGGGLACIQAASLPLGVGGNYYNYSYGGYNAYQYCSTLVYGSCPGGTRCVPVTPSGTTGVCAY